MIDLKDQLDDDDDDTPDDPNDQTESPPTESLVWYFGGRKYYTTHPNAGERDLPDDCHNSRFDENE